MARPKSSILERIGRLSHREETCLIWDGKLHRGKPYMRYPVGNPVRVLLNLVGQPRIQVRSVCPHARCIEPTHWRVIIENNFKYDDLPPPDWIDPRKPTDGQFTHREVEEIEENAELLQNNEITEEDLGIFPAHIRDEIIRRAGTS